jgi:hypothetical protein
MSLPNRSTTQHSKGLFRKATLLATVAFLLSTFAIAAKAAATKSGQGQKDPAPAASPSKGDRWLHVRVINSETKGETVRVNIPLELAEKVLPAINKSELHNGKVRIANAHMDEIDIRALAEALRTSKDGEFVTVQARDTDVRVAKQNGFMLVNVIERNTSKNNKVDIKVPMKVVDALLSAGKDELDIVAALHALSAQGDVELVTVKNDENTVRVWVDSKNASE